MLVYIREGEAKEIMNEIEEYEIPLHLKERFDDENKFTIQL